MGRGRLLSLAVALALLAPVAPARADTPNAGTLHLATVGVFSMPTYVTSPPGDPSRILVVQQGGEIALVRDGVRQPAPFLTVPNVRNDGEQGLLSMAFAPDYATSGRFYVFYNDSTQCAVAGSDPGCDVRVDEYRRADSDHADPATQRPVLQISHRQHSNHNGGQLEFGRDGLLYAGVGDGGGTGDPDHNAQDDSTLLGKILRIAPATPGASPQVWAKGLRNPFRFSFDALTGDLTIADPGQDRREELDFLPAGAAPGFNFGWPVCEGDLTYPGGGPCPANPVPNYVPPVLTYPTHVNGTCAVIGGYVVRDYSLTELYGSYVYGDFCAGGVRAATLAPSGASGDEPLGLQVGHLSSFGQDARCRVYVASLSGPVYRLESTAPRGPARCGPPDVTRPRLSALRMLRTRFAVGPAPTAVSAVARRQPRARRGTAFRYTVSEAGAVTFRLYRLLPGRRVGRLCLAPTRGRRIQLRCTRALLRGTLQRAIPRPGRRSTAFSGRVGRRPLGPGSYRATLRAIDAAGNVSRAVSTRFEIVPSYS